MALNVQKTSSYAVTCKKCQHTMAEKADAYVCPNCGNTISRQELEATLREAVASGKVTKSHSVSFSKPSARILPFQPLPPDGLQSAQNAIRKTGLFAITLGSIDLALTLAGMGAWLSDSRLRSSSLTMVASVWGAQAVLLLVTGYIVKQVAQNNAHRTANALSFMGFGLGALILLSLLRPGRVSLIEMLHLLIFGSIMKSLKFAKRLQVPSQPTDTSNPKAA